MSERDAGLTPRRRRQARIVAMQSLFEADLVGHDPLAVLERNLAEGEAGEVDAAYARQLVAGVVEHRAEIDRILAQAAPLWPLEQMPPVDKNVLRLAIYELLFDNRRVPMKAAINEAVEIAKIFGSDSSSRFVNGVLGTVAAGRGQQA
ncbi:MAG TPA: transcription antitermination factor NusB [Chloroflexota bacterium]|nr:transcription antitermination factor NusB [Chloroflexota bacterium]